MRERKNVKSFGAGFFQKAGRSPQRAKYHSCISSKISARYFCGKHPTQTGPLHRLCAPQCTKKKKTPKGVFFFLVRKMGLEPTRHGHTHLKRACLPIPALPHKAMPWHCKKYFSIPAAKKQGLFGLFFKLLTTVPSCTKIVRYTASFTPFSRIAAKNFNFFQNRACIFAQALIY